MDDRIARKRGDLVSKWLLLRIEKVVVVVIQKIRLQGGIITPTWTD